MRVVGVVCWVEEDVWDGEEDAVADEMADEAASAAGRRRRGVV